MLKKLVAPLVLVGLLAACGSDDSGAETSFNDADVMFAQMMIPHHEQAIEMSDIALDPTVGAGAAVVELATGIKEAQGPEIEQMKNLLTEWGAPLTPDDGMDHGSMMEGMLTPEQLDELAGLSGAEFDARWAAAMIAHHEGAVAMAEDVLADGVNDETRDLAEAIIETQQAEIAELTPLAGS